MWGGGGGGGGEGVQPAKCLAPLNILNLAHLPSPRNIQNLPTQPPPPPPPNPILKTFLSLCIIITVILLSLSTGIHGFWYSLFHILVRSWGTTDEFTTTPLQLHNGLSCPSFAGKVSGFTFFFGVYVDSICTAFVNKISRRYGKQTRRDLIACLSCEFKKLLRTFM